MQRHIIMKTVVGHYCYIIIHKVRQRKRMKDREIIIVSDEGERVELSEWCCGIGPGAEGEGGRRIMTL